MTKKQELFIRKHRVIGRRIQKLVVVGRGGIHRSSDWKRYLSDYMAALYPTGLNPETTIFFNHETSIK